MTNPVDPELYSVLEKDIIQLIEIPTSPNRCPFFDVVFLLENIHSQKNLNCLNNDITFSLLIDNEVIHGHIKYSEQLFKEENIKLMSRYYINVINNIVNNINIKISDIIILEHTDKHRLLQNFKDNTKDYPIKQTINQLFEQQVYKTPNNIAVIHKGTQLNYKEINDKANQLARLLRKNAFHNGTV